MPTASRRRAGVVAETPEDAASRDHELGGQAVVKIQVQAGGRGKGGGVALCRSPEEATEAARRMLGSDFKGLHGHARARRGAPADRARVLHVGAARPVRSASTSWMLTAEGGMDIETLAGERPEAIRRVHVNPGARDARLARARAHRHAAGRRARGRRRGAPHDVGRCSTRWTRRSSRSTRSCSFEDGSVVALDAKVTIDDSALFRHPDIEALADAFPIDPVEKRAKDADLQYVKLDGEVGIIGNGAGLVMSTLDVVAQAGAHAANFLDIGGGRQRGEDGDLAAGDPVGPGGARRVFINIFGGITRCDVVANGILEALGRVEATVPLVVRLDGTNAEEGRRILAEAAHPRIVPVATMDDAAAEAARLANGGAA